MITVRRWAPRALTALARGVEEFVADRGYRLAAQIAYYVLFSIFPVAIVVTALLGLVLDDAAARDQVVDFLRRNIPLLARASSANIDAALRDVASDATTLGLGALAVLGWSATAMMAATRDALNVAWDALDTRPFFRGKLIDLLLVILVGIAIACSFALTVVSSVVSERLDLPVVDQLLEGGVLVSLAVSLGAFLFVYRVVPSAQTTLSEIWPGAVVGALIFEALKGLFGVYLDNFSSYSAVYGSLGAVAAFLFFVFLAANALVLGAEIASEWPAVARGEHDDEESEPTGRRIKRFVRGLFVRQA